VILPPLVFPGAIIIKQVDRNKSSLLLKIIFQNTQTKLKQKLFAKVVREPSKEAWVWLDRESN
jgi:hypothetical protein